MIIINVIFRLGIGMLAEDLSCNSRAIHKSFNLWTVAAANGYPTAASGYPAAPSGYPAGVSGYPAATSGYPAAPSGYPAAPRDENSGH